MMNRASDSARLSARRMQSRLRETSLNLPRLRWTRRSGAAPDVADPSTAMFQRIRRSMTLLYTAVFVVMLLLAGTILYVAVQQTVLRTYIYPARENLDTSVTRLTNDWVNNYAQVGATPCQFVVPERLSIYACYDSHGNLTGAADFANVVPSFTNVSLARSALRDPSGCASDTLNASGQLGDILREACVVRAPANGQVLGVIQVGVSIGPALEWLHALQILLLIVGGFTILISAIGGFILSARALVPARLAYTRQQQFIGDVSHELRTPLTLLRADAEMLLRRRDKLPPDDAELLDDIVDETARLATLTSNLLTLARLDSGNHQPERELVDLADVAANVTRRTAAFAGERQVTVRATTEPGLLVSGVRDLIDQAALILVDNAIKYNRPGGQVEVRAERRGARVALIVSDTGVGVAPEHLEHLGERFYRPDKARARQSGQDGGAGLGISIARSVAALHQGTLTFASAPDEGLTATLNLPAARARHEAAPEPRRITDADAPASPKAAEAQETHDALL